MSDLETPKIGQGKAGPGRPKGLANKTTKLLKDAILEAAEAAGSDTEQGGMVGYLTAQAKANPGPFMALLGKVLPTQLAGAGEDGEHLVKVSADAAFAEFTSQMAVLAARAAGGAEGEG